MAVGNDVKAAGLAEVRCGALGGTDPALFLSLGTGVAAAVLVAGRVLPGAHGAAGEVGYTLCGPTDAGGIAAGHAPLEEFAGGRFIGIRASRMLGRSVTAADAFASTEPDVRELVDRTLDQLAVHVANMAILLDPERIAVGGGLMASGDRVIAALERRLTQAVPFPPAVVRSRFIHDSALRGAIVLALDPQAAEAGPAAVPANGDSRRGP